VGREELRGAGAELARAGRAGAGATVAGTAEEAEAGAAAAADAADAADAAALALAADRASRSLMLLRACVTGSSQSGWPFCATHWVQLLGLEFAQQAKGGRDGNQNHPVVVFSIYHFVRFSVIFIHYSTSYTRFSKESFLGSACCPACLCVPCSFILPLASAPHGRRPYAMLPTGHWVSRAHRTLSRLPSLTVGLTGFPLGHWECGSSSSSSSSSRILAYPLQCSSNLGCATFIAPMVCRSLFLLRALCVDSRRGCAVLPDLLSPLHLAHPTPSLQTMRTGGVRGLLAGTRAAAAACQQCSFEQQQQ
jgi:hypothetical protein